MPNTYVSLSDPSTVSGTLLSDVHTQTLNAGDNTRNHGLKKTIISFTVQDGNDFVEVTGNIIDSDNFNLNLAAGSIVNAKITLIYVV